LCLSSIQPKEHAIAISLRSSKGGSSAKFENFSHDGSFQSKKKKRRLFRKQITKELFFQSRCKEVRTKHLEYEDRLTHIIMNAPLENQ
jgi:hypothetical protein